MKRLMLGSALLATTSVAHADIYGLLSGRTADIKSEPQTTLEAGASFEGDFTTIGGRFNFKLSPTSLFYATLADIDTDAEDGDMALGGGLVYQLDQRNAQSFNVAIKGSYHLWSTDRALGVEADFSDFALELILSPKQQTVAQGVSVYAMIGFHRISSEVNLGFFGSTKNTDTELAFGGGATFAVGPGEAYVALEVIDETFIGFGYRLALGQ